MSPSIKTAVYSETSPLESVILHTPGPEIENMTPLNAERALYSDILNLSVASREYKQLYQVIDRFAKILKVEDLLEDILRNEKHKEDLVRKIIQGEHNKDILDNLLSAKPAELAKLLIQGVPLQLDTLTKFMEREEFALRPLHNFFFTRDSAVCLYDKVLIGKMASQVRERESMIMEAIFNHHPLLDATTVNPLDCKGCEPGISIEGGDVLIANQKIVLVGTGPRTSTRGVDFILDCLKQEEETRHVIVQELPSQPESFIHLDMAFTFLAEDQCMVYEPLIMKPDRFRTVHITIDNKQVVSIKAVKNIPETLAELGMEMEMICCGGSNDRLLQEREQWHSGTNFFALAPGKVIGYERNVHTLTAMNEKGYHILRAEDVISGKCNPDEYSRFVISIEGSELARGGGGPRCMTMPVTRKI